MIPWGKILAGAALVLGGGGAASIPSIIAWAAGDKTEVAVPADPQQAEYPLLDWLREQSYHMPPEESSE